MQASPIGFIGNGVVGGGMARRALACGMQVVVHDLRAEAMQAIVTEGEGRARAVSSNAEVAASSTCIVVSLPRREDVVAAFCAPGGLIEGLQPGTLVIETSTVPPEVLPELLEAVEARGSMLIDAPLCPSQNQTLTHRPIPHIEGAANAAMRAARAGNLCFFVGGSDAAFAAARPVLDMLGIESHHVGPVGAGKTVKLIHNAINLTELAVIAEMLLVAKRAGLDLMKVVDTLSTSLADSAMLRAQGRDFIARQHFPKGLFPLPFSVKDLDYGLELAAANGVSPKVAGAAYLLFSEAAQTRWGEYYNPAIFRYLEERAETNADDAS